VGYVHRDIKPGNIMWLPRQNRWTLIDFGCAARIGEEANIGYSLAYAAPEVIHAVRDGKRRMVATDKLDSWSLGVMAVELLTNKLPFNLLEGKEKVRLAARRFPGVEGGLRSMLACCRIWRRNRHACSPCMLARWSAVMQAFQQLQARGPMCSLHAPRGTLMRSWHWQADPCMRAYR
jgi:serine/threonine protein kinase